MRPDDFFTEELSEDAWPITVLDRDLLESVMKGNIQEPDAHVAAVTLELLRSELETYANGNSNRIKDDADIELVVRAARMACKRAGVNFPALPFRNFSTWMAHWRKEGLTGAGSWQARRDHLASLFEPAYRQLENLQLQALEEELAQGVTPWGRTGWRAVDDEIADLRRRFDVAGLRRTTAPLEPHAYAFLRQLETPSTTHNTILGPVRPTFRAIERRSASGER